MSSGNEKLGEISDAPVGTIDAAASTDSRFPIPDSRHHCPALLVSAPASGQGKTSVTAAIARWHARQGRRVRVFKTGPDFLDPMVLEHASGHRVYQLDLWMCGEQDVRARLHAAAGEADTHHHVLHAHDIRCRTVYVALGFSGEAPGCADDPVSPPAGCSAAG